MIAEIRIRLHADGNMELNVSAGCTKVLALGMMELAKLSLVKEEKGSPPPRILVPQLNPVS